MTAPIPPADAPVRQPAWLAPALGLAGAAFSVALFASLGAAERERATARFADRAQDHQALIQRNYDTPLELLESLAGLLNTGEFMTPTEFRQFARSSLARHPAVIALEWVPRVRGADRQRYEKLIRERVAPDFRIRDADAPGPAPARGEYFPVQYTEPADRNRGALGADYATDPARRAAMDAARDAAAPRCAVPVEPVPGEGGGQAGPCVALFVPVYAPDVPLGTAEERRRHLVGFVTALVSVPDSISPAPGEASARGFDVAVVRPAEGGGDQPVYPREAVPPAAGLRWRGPLNVAGTRLDLVCRAGPEFADSPRYGAAWGGLSAGLLLSALTAGYFHAARRREGELRRSAAAIRQEAAERQRAQAEWEKLFTVAPDLMSVAGLDGYFRRVNPAFTRVLGYTAEELVARPCYDFVHPDDAAATRAEIDRIARGAPSPVFENRYRCKDGSWRWLAWSNPAPGPGEHLIYGVARDVTERKRAEHLEAGQRLFLELVALGRPLPEVMDFLTRFIDEESDGARTSVLLLDPDGRRLRHGAAPSLPDGYNRLIDGVEIGPAVGSCGTAAFRREAVHVADIAADPLWAPYRDLALPHGLRACASVPFLSAAGEVLGTFAMYFASPRVPTRHEVRLMETSGQLLALAVERERAAEALRDSERRFRVLFEKNMAGVVRNTLDGVVLEVNDAFARIVGYESAAEIREVPLVELYFDPAEREAMIGRLLAEKTLTNHELRLRRRDGRPVWCLANVALVEDRGRAVVQGALVDVTERKRAEEALRASERMLQTVLDNIPQGVFWKDRGSRYLGCNRVAARPWGLEPADLVGKTDRDIAALRPEQVAFFLRKDREVMDADAPELNILEPATLPGGETVWLETCKIPMHDSDGRVVGVLGTWQDVTERKNAREALERSNRMLDALSRSLARFIAGPPASPVFDEMLATLLAVTDSGCGFIAEVLQAEDRRPHLRTHAARNGTRAADGSDFPGLPALFAAVLDSGAPVVSEDPRPGGPPRPLLALPFHRGTELIGVAGVADRPGGYDPGLVRFLGPFLQTCASMIVGLRNDRARRRAEEANREALAEKEALLKEIHHRVKNNLQVISSLLNLQAERLTDPAARAVFVESQARVRAMALVHETLYGSGTLARIDLPRYVESLCGHLLRTFGGAARVAVERRVAVESLDLDRALPVGLVVNELVSNALKYAFPGGRGGRVSVSLDARPGAGYTLVVADDGVGLPDHVDLAGRRSLGLHLVGLLARQLRGTVEVTRSPGTTFAISFPE
jgi:PAS domain S-box-containing protein